MKALSRPSSPRPTVNAVLISVPRAARVRSEPVNANRPPKRSIGPSTGEGGAGAGGDCGAAWLIAVMVGLRAPSSIRRPPYSPHPMRASVIMPARDAEATIARSLEALARQDLDGGYEVIVVDDGWSDRTAELAERAAGRLSGLR